MAIKGQYSGFFGVNGTVLYTDGGGSYMNLYRQ